MAIWTDNEARSWPLRIDWAAMRRAKAAGADLSNAEELLGDFFRGSVLLIETLWAIHEPEAIKRGIDREAFEAAVSGAAMEKAREALLEGLSDFFSPTRAELLRAAVAEVAAQIQSLAEISRKRFIESPEPSA